jgi:Carboxypeptidase regulatory-like domain
MMRLVVALVVAAAIAVIAWWLLHGSTPAAPGAPGQSELPAVGAGAQPESAPQSSPLDRKIRPAAFVESRAAEQSELPGVAAAEFRGRCVDAVSRRPLAGCVAKVHGWEANSERVDLYVARHGPIAWKDPADVVTGADGRFEVRFAPPPPYQFVLTLSAPARANMEGRWFEVKPGAVIDVGDVPMPPGTTVSGRIVDESETIQPGASVTFTFQGPTPAAKSGDSSSPVVGPRNSFHTGSRPDGTFVLHSPMQAGTYALEVANRKVLEPATVEMREGEAERAIDVKLRAESDAETIEGVVRDDQGNPVRGASVDCDPRGADSRGTFRIVTSGRDGAFRIVRVNQDPQAEVTISARRTGYEPSAEPVKARWGARDVVLVLRRGRTVQVAVRDGDRNQPLERYGVRCFPAPSFMGFRSSEDGRLRERGEHAEGVLDLGEVPRGRQLLIVEPEGPEWGPSVAQEFEMTDAGAPRQEVTVWRNLEKTVRVKRHDGAPVAGSKLDLLRKVSERPIDQETYTVSPGQLAMMSGGVHAIKLSAGETAPDGTVRIAGPPRERLVLRALGPGHVPLVREIELTAGEEVIELVVSSGATFAGRLLPPEVLKQIVGPDPPPPRPGRPARGSSSGVFLRQKATRLEHPVGNTASLEQDGSFRIEGAGAGKWEVHLRYPEPMGGGGAILKSHHLGAVELVDGQERRQDYDLSNFVKAEIEGTVTLDGEPLEDATVGFHGARVLPDGEAELDTVFMRLKPGGKFTMALWPGDYRLAAHVARGKRSQTLFDDEVVTIAPGQKLAKAFDLPKSVSKLRVVGTDGSTPLGGVVLMFEIPKAPWPVNSLPTNAEGTVDVEGLPRGPIPVFVWPKDLSTSEAQIEFLRRRAGRGIPKDALVRVTTITITPPETSAMVVLPASSGY